jgi:hypothetical protein
MNAINKCMVSKDPNITKARTSLTLIKDEKCDKKEAVTMTKEYLNEKLYCFYTNGGPIMDI